MEEFGKNSAVAFQIQDDLLNIVGDEITTGKDYLNDILESKRTLMVIHCLETAAPSEKARLAALLRLGPAKSPAQVQEVVGLLYQHGSIEYARTLARGLILEARSYLEVAAPVVGPRRAGVDGRLLPRARQLDRGVMGTPDSVERYR